MEAAAPQPGDHNRRRLCWTKHFPKTGFSERAHSRAVSHVGEPHLVVCRALTRCESFAPRRHRDAEAWVRRRYDLVNHRRQWWCVSISSGAERSTTPIVIVESDAHDESFARRSLARQACDSDDRRRALLRTCTVFG